MVRTAAMARPRRAFEDSLSPGATFLFTVIILFIYLPLLPLGQYNVTIGTLAGLYVFAYGVLKNHSEYRYVPVFLFFTSYPIIIFSFHIFLDTKYNIPLFRFLLSYALWFVSMGVMWAAFQKRTWLADADVRLVVVILFVLAILQFVSRQFLGTTALFDMIQAIGIAPEYMNFDGEDTTVRAIGTYYEPSMLGRIICTLAAVMLVRRTSIWMVPLVLVVTLYVSKSFSIVILAAAIMLIYYGEVSLRAVFAAAGLMVGYFVFQDLILERLTLDPGNSFTSSYVRLVMPLHSMYEMFTEYIFGVPIGANVAVVYYTIRPHYPIYEAKITNGFYEFFLYFSWVGIVVLLVLVAAMIYLIAMKRRGDAIIVAFMILSTAASSSYLSIESSVILYFLIAMLKAVPAVEARVAAANRYNSGMAPVLRRPEAGSVAGRPT